MRRALVLAAVAGFHAWLPMTSFAQVQPPAEHSFSGNISAVSEYRYRGISQTNSRPALQGGVDYAHSRGYYAGLWASNVSWLADGGGGALSNSLEVDLVGGYRRQMGDFSYDAGLLGYYYPGKYPTGFNRPHTAEVFLAGTWKMLTLKYSHALTDIFGFPDSKGAGYVDASASTEVGNGYTLRAHVGYQLIPESLANARAKSDCSYTDWSLGVSRAVSAVNVGLTYVDTNAKGDAGQCYRNAFNKNLGRQTLVLSVGTTF